jgi:hypothetical protein
MPAFYFLSLRRFGGEPQLDQPANGFGAGWKIMLARSPVVQACRHHRLDAHHDRLSGNGCPALPWFRDTAS